MGLWRINPASRPSWWPFQTESAGTIDTTPINIWKQVEALWEKSTADDWVVAEAGGRVHEGKTIYDLELFGVFQKCISGKEPELGDIAEWYRWRNHAETSHGNLRFDGMLKSVRLESFTQEFDGWTFVPAACRVNPWTVSRWQFWRAFRDLWVPAPFLSNQTIDFTCTKEGLIATTGGQILGRWHDWTEVLQEKLIDGISPSTGQSMMLSKPFIEDFTRRTRSEFCWVCRLVGYHREQTYETFKRFTDCRHFGGSHVVLP